MRTLRNTEFAHLTHLEWRGLCRYARRRVLFRLKEIIGCADCGYRKSGLALDFDHARGVKEFSIATNVGLSWPRILAELAKCDVRCSNCHRIKTEERRVRPAPTPRDVEEDTSRAKRRRTVAMRDGLIRSMLADGKGATEIARAVGCCRATVYRLRAKDST